MPEIRIAEVSRSHFVRYAGASGDFNPLHHDELAARAAGFPSVFGMGMFTAGVLSRIVMGFVAGSTVRRFTVRFVNQLWPGDALCCRGQLTRKFTEGDRRLIEGEVEATNQRGEVLARGRFVAALPPRTDDRLPRG